MVFWSLLIPVSTDSVWPNHEQYQYAKRKNRYWLSSGGMLAVLHVVESRLQPQNFRVCFLNPVQIHPGWILIPVRSGSRQSPKTESKFLKMHYADFWRGQTSSFHLCTWKVINWFVPGYSVWVIKIVSSQGGPPLVMKFRRAEYLLDFASLTQMPGYQLPVPKEQSHSEIRRWQPALISPGNTLMCLPSSKLPDGCNESEKRLC